MNDIDALVSKLESKDSITRVKARDELVALGKAAVPSLVEALKNKRDWTRWEAAKALAQIGNSKSTLALIDALEDKEFSVRWLAAEGLINIGPSTLEPLLEALIHRSDSPWLLEGAHRVLHDLQDINSLQYIKPVISALEDIDSSLNVIMAAKSALDSIKIASST